MNNVKILIVEDSIDWHELWKDKFDGKATILSALTIEQAMDLFFENQDVSAIVMDACVPGNVPTTPPLVRQIRLAYQGPMIAVSSNAEYRQKLMRAGCSHDCPEKQDLPQFVTAILCL